MRRRSLAAVIVAVALVVAGAGCNRDRGATADPTVPTAPPSSSSTSSTTAEPDIATIPAVIDAAYLNRVLAAFDDLDFEAVRLIQKQKRVSSEASDIFHAFYGDTWFSTKIDSWISQVNGDPELKGLKQPVGPRHTSVERLIHVSPSCSWIAVKRDYSEANTVPIPPRTEYLALVPLDPKNDPNHRNKTAWMIATDGFRKDGSEPSNPCPTE
ncbi:MAG TPA: hypothetical protein VFJ85_00610 [Acidimicrobiales bacterium]|nr:hypothetical protein [Acidimicrobiales bacterium]